MSVEFEHEENVSSVKTLGTRDRPLQISEITSLIKTQLETEFSEVVVVGEISNFKAHPSGHFYFCLKDESAMINAVMFRGSNQNLRFEVQNGMKVIGVGRLSVYPPRGSYQIVLSRMEPDGLGALQLAFEQLKAKLEKEGLFAPERKKKLPKFPRRIGVITSSSGAAIRDILNVLNRRFAGLHLLIYSVKVQGEGAAEEIAEAIRHLNEFFPDIDVMIVGRGGGSLEDLWPFNEEIVARAIFDSQIPIISAVGHEIDFTIADFVADVRAPTPSAAAELVVADKQETLKHLAHLVRRLRQSLRKLEYLQMKADELQQALSRVLNEKIYSLRLRFERLLTKIARQQPLLKLQQLKYKLERNKELIAIHLSEKIANLSDRCREAKTRLELLNPKAIMERGYSIVRLEKNFKLVRKAADIQMGDVLIIELYKGSIRAKV